MPNKYYGKLDNGTNPQAVMYPNEKPDVPKSYFDESNVVTQTQTLGGIYPFYLIRTVPSDQFELGVDLLVTVTNPFVRRMLSTLNITTHFFYDSMSHLWEGGKNHFTKGRTGNISITFPYVNIGHYPIHLCPDSFESSIVTGTSPSVQCSFDNQMSLAAYFDVPYTAYSSSLSGYGSGLAALNPETGVADGEFRHYRVANNNDVNQQVLSSWKLMPTASGTVNSYVNALPFAMYQKIYAETYAPKNLLVNNKNWYPDNPDDFILPYNSGGTEVTVMSRSNPSPLPLYFSTVPLGAVSSGNSFDYPLLTCLRFRQWQGDYFTAAVPWIVRGDMYKMDFSDLGLLPVKTMSAGGTSEKSGYFKDSNSASGVQQTSADPNLGALAMSSSSDPYGRGTSFLYADASGNSFAITANQIYELLALSRWQERNTRTDGDYNSLIKAHFNVDPKTEDWHSTYIGGTFTRMQFSEVLQTNQDSTSTTPLGSQVSRGVANQSGYVGKFTAPDFGYVMGLCSIIPNTYYSQGLPRSMWYNTTNEDEYYPEFNSMAPQGILNKEIFYDLGTPTVNEDLFAYTERYADYKYMPNRARACFAAPPSVTLEWSAYSYARYFSSTPSFNSRFVTCYGFRRDMWSVPLVPEFAVQIVTKCDAVRPIPYDSIPGGNINV